MNEQHTLDVRSQLCPLPVIKTQNRMKSLVPGEQLTVFCTDPGALKDIPAWCKINGHKVLESREEGQEIIFLIEKSADDDSVMM